MTKVDHLHAFALLYVARGLRVLPLRPKGKEPLLAHGVHDASNDPITVDGWWRRWPDANIGIAVPPPWLIVDIDPRNGGDVELARLEAEHGALPRTVSARTGSGGEHRIFVRPAKRLRGKLGPGIDLLGDGRYFLVAPSVHPCGGSYEWTTTRDTKVASAPGWLVDLAEMPDATTAIQVSRDTVEPSVIDRARKYLAKCPPAISGSGGHTTTFLVAQRLVRGFALDEKSAVDLLAEWNERCQPPWGKRELARKVSEAMRAGTLPEGNLRDRPLPTR